MSLRVISPINKFKNFIINPQGIVFQRAVAYNLVNGAYGIAADRLFGMAAGTAVTAGIFTQLTGGNCGITGYGFNFTGVTITGAGTISLRYRMESIDAMQFKNKIASFSARVYHTVGAALNYTIYIRKANAPDNFGAVTAIANTVIAVNQTIDTYLKFPGIAMGDCSNGIEIEIVVSCGAIVTQSFQFTDLQFELGNTVNDFLAKVYTEELLNCLRYYEKIVTVAPFDVYGVGFCYNTTTAETYVRYALKRKQPNISFPAAGEFSIFHRNGVTVCTAIQEQYVGFQTMNVHCTVAAGLDVGYGCQLHGNNIDNNSYIAIEAEL